MKCNISIYITPIINDNMKIDCKEEMQYEVSSKSNPEFKFYCCDFHTYLFPLSEYDFRKV